MAQWRRLYRGQLLASSTKDSRLRTGLTKRQGTYTLLVAWHKFDKYERNNLQRIVEVPLEKLPFQRLSYVWHQLGYFLSQRKFYVQVDPIIPVQDYMKRILTAVKKEERKRRQRIK